ncbi:hypothetical protein G7046_g1500 [Stylonectria norvegica]|nr:hypothetical protein G7046_g1500 [Stylonectria norvegica]
MFMTQGQLLGGNVHGIPRIFIHPVRPRGSDVFRIASDGSLDELRVLLSEGEASIRDHDEYGWGLLHFAAHSGEVDICRFLIEAGADIDEVTEDNSTPLSLCAESYSYDATQLLIHNMADPTNSTTRDNSPFNVTAVKGDYLSLGLLMQSPFNTDGEINTPREWSTSLLQVLYHGEGDAKGAWVYGNRDLCVSKVGATLVAAGADVNARTDDEYRSTCLHVLLHNLDPTGWNNDKNMQDMLQCAIYLIQRGANVHALDGHGRSVSACAYLPDQGGFPWDVGSYRGDLWDAALAACGYDLVEFRQHFPRIPQYSSYYQRSDFEKLWEGKEEQCPYWDDRPWPVPPDNTSCKQMPESPHDCDYPEDLAGNIKNSSDTISEHGVIYKAIVVEQFHVDQHTITYDYDYTRRNATHSLLSADTQAKESEDPISQAFEASDGAKASHNPSHSPLPKASINASPQHSSPPISPNPPPPPRRDSRLDSV